MKVTINGEAKDALTGFAGIYIHDPKLVNGKSHWLQNPGSNAIWYHRSIIGRSEDWNIGSKKDLGTIVNNPGIIISEIDVAGAGPQDAKTWKYVNQFIASTSEDIKVDEIIEPGTYQ